MRHDLDGTDLLIDRLGPYHLLVITGIDVGNSAVKVARIDVNACSLIEVIPAASSNASFRAATAERLAANAAGGPAQPADRRSNAIVLVSVVPAWTEALRKSADAHGVHLLIADEGTIPIRSRVDRPARVGADRLLDAFAASRLHGNPVIVVDLGTATTIDAVDATGAFVGGAILPGIDLGARALAAGTAQLPLVAVSELPAAIGRSTREAIASGVVLGQVGAVREIVARIGSALAGDGGPAVARPMVVVTGGLSRAAWAGVWQEPFGGLPAIADVVDPDLTLRGLGLLHAELAGLPA